MTDATIAPAFGRRDRADVIDADYVVVGRGAPAARPAPVVAVASSAGGMDVLRGADTAAPRKAQPGGPLFWLCGGLAVFAAFWTAGGHHAFRHLYADAEPAGPAISRDLRIASFNSFVDPMGRVAQLVIDGEAVNDGRDPAALPSIEIQVVSGNGATTRYKLGTGGMWLNGGASFPFSGRLDMPKHGVKTVSVAFVE